MAADADILRKTLDGLSPAELDAIVAALRDARPDVRDGAGAGSGAGAAPLIGSSGLMRALRRRGFPGRSSPAAVSNGRGRDS